MLSNVKVLVVEPVDVRAMINLFTAQSGVNYKIDELLLIKIAGALEEGPTNKSDNRITNETERFMELEYKVRRELASGKSRYSDVQVRL